VLGDGGLGETERLDQVAEADRLVARGTSITRKVVLVPR
jgi:hypothetical protein